MRKSEISGLAIILTAGIAAILVYSALPVEMISHWGIDGEAIGTMHKNTFLKWNLATMCGIFAAFAGMSRIEKLRPQTRQTQLYYGTGLNITLLFYFAVYLAVMLWNLGIKCNILTVISIGLGVMLFFIGRVIRHAKSHWFVSFRTPWAKRNEQVWNKTHHLLGNLLCAIGVGGIVASFFTFYAIVAVHIAMFAVIFAFAYSYFQYRKIKFVEL